MRLRKLDDELAELADADRKPRIRLELGAQLGVIAEYVRVTADDVAQIANLPPTLVSEVFDDKFVPSLPIVTCIWTALKPYMPRRRPRRPLPTKPVLEVELRSPMPSTAALAMSMAFDES